MDYTDQIPSLIVKQIKGTIEPEEMKVLARWLEENEGNKELYEKMLKDQYLLDKLDVYNRFDRGKAWSRIEQILVEDPVRIRLISSTLLKYAAILVPIAMVAVAALYHFSDREIREVAEKGEIITPGSQKATLILADGSSVELEKENAVKEILQGDTKITNDQQSLTYNTSESSRKNENVVYNELITPIGGTYQLTLSDQSVVVLNAGSSLRFPVEFEKEKRQVFLSGEAYFKVQHDGRPFYVTCEAMDVQVLGTSFNISAYEDDAIISTTLVEGSVRVSSGDRGNQKVLAPDDQAIFEKTGSEFEIKKVDTSLYTSWVNGKFEFGNENLDVVMRKLSRWYDFEYVFKNNDAKNFHFSARISNDQKISTILEMLEMTTDVRFEVRGRTIEIFKTGTSN